MPNNQNFSGFHFLSKNNKKVQNGSRICYPSISFLMISERKLRSELRVEEVFFSYQYVIYFCVNIRLRHNIYFSMRNKANRLYEVIVIITDFKFRNHKEADRHRKNRKFSYILFEGAVKNGGPIQGALGLIYLKK